LSVNSLPSGKSSEGIYNLVGNAAEWTSSIRDRGEITYETARKWDGNPDTFDGTLVYVQRGGGWDENVEEVGLDIPDLGTSARDDLGFRCVADVN
jgi:formylglycine-generating enzyme required for sulfatase activity